MRPHIPVAIYASMIALALARPDLSQTIETIAFYMTLGQAVNIFVGLTGYVNFGYAAFLAMGAYGLGVVIAYMPWLGIWTLPLGLALGALLATALAAAVGAVALRLRSAYFAIATIGINEGLKNLIIGANIWGGSAGLVLGYNMFQTYGRETALFLSTTGSAVLVLATGLLAVVATYLLQSGQAGYALAAIRQDEDAAKVMGINPTKYKLIAFSLSAVFSALLGSAAFPLAATQVFPDVVFSVGYILDGLAVAFLGGIGTTTGPIIGGLLYVPIRLLVGQTLPSYQSLITPVMVLLIILLMPRGLVGEVRRRLPGRAKEWLP
ncbi:branched-chain amino acid ABC transporter permease [Thermoproteus tenax]|uniref:Branched-chain amino acid transport permease, LivM n=1 Tax=Thermoproteus tenax (strain ATCC 35583 / DSM 2078 / JCM 9277 / NBRC 100435 / Kra 1) TaxID=768679 RepID=G4RNK7_THETK|nr:branched-chain amino acid ABC transporter permease [Thermoproteus tenax]CCC81151.1 branched-chain amino acid transport permease, LivM [Thermoproteus tenax Kra 1]